MKKSSLYTKRGDKGKTTFFDGAGTDKSNIVLECCGTIDEINSFTGLFRSRVEESQLLMEHCREDIILLKGIQKQLFRMGTLIVTSYEDRKKLSFSDVDGEFLSKIEKRIDVLDDMLPPLKNFVLPSGDYRASLCHVCRSACRRMERIMVRANIERRARGLLTDTMQAFANRLSDYFFVLARSINVVSGIEEEVWKE